MVSTTVNVSLTAFPCQNISPDHVIYQVVRYTALFSGVLYGWFHRRNLQAVHNQQ